MKDPTRRSVLRTSFGLAAAGALARPYIANAAATTAEMWFPQGFAKQEDEALLRLVADYQKTAGNKIDLSIIPFAPLRQKEVGGHQRRRPRPDGPFPIVGLLEFPNLRHIPCSRWPS